MRSFGDAEETSLQDLVLAALEAEGKVLSDLGRYVEALNDLLVRSVGSEEPVVLDHVAWALVHKASSCASAGQAESVVPLLEEAVERFADSQRPAQILAASTAQTMLEDYGPSAPIS